MDRPFDLNYSEEIGGIMRSNILRIYKANY